MQLRAGWLAGRQGMWTSEKIAEVGIREKI